MSKRFFLIIFVFLISVTTCYLVLKPSSKKQISAALTHVKHNQFTAAETALTTLHSSKTPLPLALYKGYLEQIRGNFKLSDKYLNSACEKAHTENKENILLEILMARASNAYFEGKDLELAALLERAHSLKCTSSFLDFFDGLNFYSQGRYKEALRAWNAFSQNKTVAQSEWMQVTLDKLFPPALRELQKAHCLTEEGELLSSRAILEMQSHQIDKDNQELQYLATLFLGLTYLMESDTIAYDGRDSYYKLACFYFKRARIGDQFYREKERVNVHLEQQVNTLIKTDLGTEEQKWILNLIHILQDFKAQNSIKRLTELLVLKLQEPGVENIVFCEAVRKEFLNTPFHLHLTQDMQNLLVDVLKNEETEQLFELWGIVEALSANPKLVAKQIASLTSQEIFETIKKDSKQLTTTLCFLKFWEQLGPSTYQRDLLTKKLICHAKLLWLNEKQEKKGQQLMDIALEMSPSKAELFKQIELFLTNLYTQAINSNMIRRLSLIYDALEHFEINHQQLISRSEVANHLADADYLYASRNYSAAKSHASWVLKLDPDNEKARRLVGLCAFHLGAYDKALVHLSGLKYPDETTQKALMLSRVLTPQEQEKHICQMSRTDSFEEEKD